jgi:hypothetical protein
MNERELRARAYCCAFSTPMLSMEEMNKIPAVEGLVFCDTKDWTIYRRVNTEWVRDDAMEIMLNKDLE